MDPIDAVFGQISERARTYRPSRDQGSQQPDEGGETIAVPIPAVPLEKSERDATSFESRNGDEPPQRIDLAIITAVAEPELEQVLKAFGPDWRREGKEGVVYHICSYTFNGIPVTIAAASQNDMGMVPAAILATKTLRAWSPQIVAMTGVCAGVKGKVNLGDIVVGSQVFDYGSGKVVKGKLVPDYQYATVIDHATSFVRAAAGNKKLLKGIKDKWPTESGRPDTELRAAVGPMGCGAAVVADDNLIDGVKQNKRSLIAIDMESYGIMRAAAAAHPPPIGLVVKGVQDFADSSKNDQYREYAAFVSAQFLRSFLDEYWRDLTDPGAANATT